MNKIKNKKIIIALGQLILIGIFSLPSLSILNSINTIPEKQNNIKIINENDYFNVTASWYGSAFHGRTMANGQIFNMYDENIVAHKNLPFGTKLEIINPQNNEILYAVVKDRGPYIIGRDIDLSYAGAQKLGIVNQGVEKLKARIIE